MCILATASNRFQSTSGCPTDGLAGLWLCTRTASQHIGARELRNTNTRTHCGYGSNSSHHQKHQQPQATAFRHHIYDIYIYIRVCNPHTHIRRPNRTHTLTHTHHNNARDSRTRYYICICIWGSYNVPYTFYRARGASNNYDTQSCFNGNELRPTTHECTRDWLHQSHYALSSHMCVCPEESRGLHLPQVRNTWR